jgi:F0F1-type ATP synthase assembly protein I
MFTFIRSKSYLFGFIAGLFLIAMVNYYTAYPREKNGKNQESIESATEDFDAYKETGWPFRFHRSGTILHLDETLWPELIADIFIGLCIGQVMGAIFYVMTWSLIQRVPKRAEKMEWEE